MQLLPTMLGTSEASSLPVTADHRFAPAPKVRMTSWSG